MLVENFRFLDYSKAEDCRILITRILNNLADAPESVKQSCRLAHDAAAQGDFGTMQMELDKARSLLLPKSDEHLTMLIKHRREIVQKTIGQGGGAPNPALIDFSDPLACANYLAGIADRLYIALNRVEAAKAHALSGELTQMDEFLERATTPLTEGHSQVQTIRHEREHLAEQKPGLACGVGEAKFSAMSWDDLPEVPPSHFAVVDTESFMVSIHTCDEWDAIILPRIPSPRLLFDISIIGHEHIHYNWRVVENRILVATPKQPEAA